MDVEIKLDSSCTETKVIIFTNNITDEITELAKKLTGNAAKILVGYSDNVMTVLDESEIVRVYAEDGKVFAATVGASYMLKLRLYEVEEILNGKYFVRISKSEIINLKKVKSFDFSITGTICVKLSGNIVTYVSRRYVSKIKSVLGI